MGFGIRSVNGRASSGTLHSLYCSTFLDSTTTLLVGYYAPSPSIGTTQCEFMNFICTILMWSNQCRFSVRDRLRRGVEEVTAADLPSFLWLKGSFDMEDPYKGFLRGPLVVMVWLVSNLNIDKLTVFNRHINTSSYPQALQGRLIGQRAAAMLHCMVSNLSHMSRSLMSQRW